MLEMRNYDGCRRKCKEKMEVLSQQVAHSLSPDILTIRMQKQNFVN